MRFLSATMLLFFLAVCASAQTESNKPAEPVVTVLEQKWRIETRNPKLEKDPIEAMAERDRQERQRKDTERTNEIRNERGMPTPTTMVPDADRSARPAGITRLHVYEMKLRNDTAKGIRKLTWDYVFLEPGTETELGRRRFISKVNISAGGTANVVVRAAAAPTGTIDARRAGKKPQDQYSEKIVIQRIEFVDGSVWRPVGN